MNLPTVFIEQNINYNEFGFHQAEVAIENAIPDSLPHVYEINYYPEECEVFYFSDDVAKVIKFKQA
jgi:hypothetical protein